MEKFDISYTIEKKPEWLISCDVEVIGLDPPEIRCTIVEVLDKVGRLFTFREWSIYNFTFFPPEYADRVIHNAKDRADAYPYGPDGNKKIMGSGWTLEPEMPCEFDGLSSKLHTL
ncbi:hypothetical protein DSECCO2_474770 [anaerobic digester metagenome]|jgi:hypothetical protein